MGNAKVEFTVGSITFSGEGEETWVSDQLDKILGKAPDLIKIVPATPATGQPIAVCSGQGSDLLDSTIASQTLPNFLRAKDAARTTARKFLTTAVWLHAKGSNRLSTNDVTKALRESNQTRLSNPSQCLIDNVRKGFIGKDGSQFFVTDEGKASLSD